MTDCRHGVDCRDFASGNFLVADAASSFHSSTKVTLTGRKEVGVLGNDGRTFIQSTIFMDVIFSNAESGVGCPR